ncbi:hypothetical protein ACL02S_03730 [Nocardia sp. 004]
MAIPLSDTTFASAAENHSEQVILLHYSVLPLWAAQMSPIE